MKFILALAVLLTAGMTNLWAQMIGAPAAGASDGVIRGTLRTYENKPASNYILDVIGASRTSTGRLRVFADDEGKFSATGLKYGDYVVAPYVEGADSRYPGGSSSFYEPDPIRIKLDETQPTQQVRIILRAPNRFLSGIVTSADGQPLLSIIEIQVEGNSDRFVRFSSTRSGSFRVLVPPKTPLLLKVTADGFVSNVQKIEPLGNGTDPQVEIKLQAKPGGR